MAAKFLVIGADAVKSPEDRLALVGRHAGAFVVDLDADLVVDAHRADLDQPARRREGYAIVDQILDHPRQS